MRGSSPHSRRHLPILLQVQNLRQVQILLPAQILPRQTRLLPLQILPRRHRRQIPEPVLAACRREVAETSPAFDPHPPQAWKRRCRRLRKAGMNSRRWRTYQFPGLPNSRPAGRLRPKIGRQTGRRLRSRRRLFPPPDSIHFPAWPWAALAPPRPGRSVAAFVPRVGPSADGRKRSLFQAC